MKFPLLVAQIFLLSSCVNYDADPFTGYTLPRVTGYSTGITNDWLYFNLRTGMSYNAASPCCDFSEGDQRDSAQIALDWDVAFCGYRLRTNSGTSGIGLGGAVDLGYSSYDKWTSADQVSSLDFSVDKNTMTVTVPRGAIGLESCPDERLDLISLRFKWADGYKPCDIYSFYKNGDAAPIGRFDYVYSNVK